MRLEKLGIPKLWRHDPELVWLPSRWFVAGAILGFLAPGSKGYGLDRVPLAGGGVVAANHFASLDHPLIGIFSPRAIFYMAKAELLEMPVVGELLGWAGGFPIRRGEADREALRTARRLVREGHLVGVHVEGTRQRLGFPGDVKIGAVMIALQEGVPVIPCAVETFGWSAKHNRRACAVVWGDPITFEGVERNQAGYANASAVIRNEIVRLWRLAAEAVANRFPPGLSDGAKRFRPYAYPLLTEGRAPLPG
jgi:1-acyl-sn-glycerol-3-phosphate acyltransferase